MARKRVAKNIRRRPRARRRDPNVVTSDNDSLSIALADLVPEDKKGTDKFLDVVQWNLEWFGATKSVARDKRRFDTVLKLLSALNGDLFVFQEIAGPSRDGRHPGALDEIAENLTQSGRGDYRVAYTDAGGEQRVAMMWDREWVRAKTEVTDLFPRGSIRTSDDRDAFATRTPLYSYFTARIVPGGDDDLGMDGAEKFDFQALGVHLKAMAEGHDQRLRSAEYLADWLKNEAPKTDVDAVIMGDWNAPPDDSCWAPFHALERSGVKFRDINDPSDYSYLWLQNRTDKWVSRIDLTALSLASEASVVGKASQVVVWKPITQAIEDSGSFTSKEVRDVMKFLKEEVSDHLPVVTRFYWETRS